MFIVQGCASQSGTCGPRKFIFPSSIRGIGLAETPYTFTHLFAVKDHRLLPKVPRKMRSRATKSSYFAEAMSIRLLGGRLPVGHEKTIFMSSSPVGLPSPRPPPCAGVSGPPAPWEAAAPQTPCESDSQVLIDKLASEQGGVTATLGDFNINEGDISTRKVPRMGTPSRSF